RSDRDWSSDVCSSDLALLHLLHADAKTPGSHHDFGMDILPKLAGSAPMFAYNFEANRIPGEVDSSPYWRDVGTIDAFYEANMDRSEERRVGKEGRCGV